MRTSTVLILIVTLVSLTCHVVHASPTAAGSAPAPKLTHSMDQIAEKVVDVLEDLGRQPQVIVGDFTSRGRSKSSGGVEIRRQLMQLLQDKGIECSETGDQWTEIVGNFRIIEREANEGDDFKSLGLDIVLEFFDADGIALKIDKIKTNEESPNELVVPIFGNEVPSLAGINVEVPPNARKKQRQQKIIEQFKNPTTAIDGNIVRNKGPFGVEILVNENGKLVPRQPTLDSGQRAFVDLNKGEEYAVRVHNDFEFPIAVALKIDGVNSFADSKDVSVDSRKIARPGKTATFKGWYFHQGKQEFFTPDGSPLPPQKAFLISGYESSVAKTRGVSSSNLSIGMITVDIRAAWSKSSLPPEDEPQLFTTRGGPQLGTGIGRDIQDKSTVVNDLQVSKRTRSLIHVRYAK